MPGSVAWQDRPSWLPQRSGSKAPVRAPSRPPSPRCWPAPPWRVHVDQPCGGRRRWRSWSSLALQVGVNYANDYSDGIRGTDEDRVGPLRLVGSGVASPRSVKRAAFASFGVAAVVGLVLAATTAWWLVAVGARLRAGRLVLHRRLAPVRLPRPRRGHGVRVLRAGGGDGHDVRPDRSTLAAGRAATPRSGSARWPARSSSPTTCATSPPTPRPASARWPWCSATPAPAALYALLLGAALVALVGVALETRRGRCSGWSPWCPRSARPRRGARRYDGPGAGPGAAADRGRRAALRRRHLRRPPRSPRPCRTVTRARPSASLAPGSEPSLARGRAVTQRRRARPGRTSSDHRDPAESTERPTRAPTRRTGTESADADAADGHERTRRSRPTGTTPVEPIDRNESVRPPRPLELPMGTACRPAYALTSTSDVSTPHARPLALTARPLALTRATARACTLTVRQSWSSLARISSNRWDIRPARSWTFAANRSRSPAQQVHRGDRGQHRGEQQRPQHRDRACRRPAT